MQARARICKKYAPPTHTRERAHTYVCTQLRQVSQPASNISAWLVAAAAAASAAAAAAPSATSAKACPAGECAPIPFSCPSTATAARSQSPPGDKEGVAPPPPPAECSDCSQAGGILPAGGEDPGQQTAAAAAAAAAAADWSRCNDGDEAHHVAVAAGSAPG